MGTIRGRGRGSVRVRVRDRGGVGLVVVALVDPLRSRGEVRADETQRGVAQPQRDGDGTLAVSTECNREVSSQ